MQYSRMWDIAVAQQGLVGAGGGGCGGQPCGTDEEHGRNQVARGMVRGGRTV